MEKKERCIELRNGQGKMLFGLYIFDREMGQEQKAPAPEPKKAESPKQEGKKNGNKRGKKQEKNQASNPPIDGDAMTDAQKRYLFRLLADQGMEGETAYQYLKDTFQVSSLKEITKSEASKVIDRLITEAQGGGDDRPPF